jgi:hypothetical protein
VVPRHEAFTYAPDEKRGRFLLALSPDRREGSALIGQDAFFSVALLEGGSTSRYRLHAAGNGVYVHCAGGAVIVSGHRLEDGDAAGVWETDGCDIEVVAPADLVLVEVPMGRGVRV